MLDLETKEGSRLYKARLYEMECRQNFQCAICTRISGSSMEFDHQSGRGYGGGNRDDRILTEDGKWMNAALCHNCNTEKGSKRYEWIDGKYVPAARLQEIA